MQSSHLLTFEKAAWEIIDIAQVKIAILANIATESIHKGIFRIKIVVQPKCPARVKYCNKVKIFFHSFEIWWIFPGFV